MERNVRRALGLCHGGYVVGNGAVGLAGTREELLRLDHVRQAYLRELFGADGGSIGLVTPRGTMRLAARVGLGADALSHR